MRAYLPHVLAVQAGSDLRFRNLSKVPDNPKWDSLNNGQVNPLLPPGAERTIMSLKPERTSVSVENSIYPWMRAYVWVLDHPYFAVTDPDGKFEIRLAPRTSLRLVIWQESMGFKNGREGRLGEPIKPTSGRLDLGEVQLKPDRK